MEQDWVIYCLTVATKMLTVQLSINHLYKGYSNKQKRRLHINVKYFLQIFILFQFKERLQSPLMKQG